MVIDMNEQVKARAILKFTEALQSCKSEQEISVFCQMTLTLASKTIHGIEGRKFKENFMNAAINDNEMIKPEMVVKH
jgi:hypothetical protein